MIRRIAFASILVVIAVGAWLWLRNQDGDPAPAAPLLAEQPVAKEQTAPAVETAKDAIPAPADAVVVRTNAASESTQPPIPEDAKWLEVLVVDAVTQQPIANAEVTWTTSASNAQVQDLPEKERQPLYSDRELVARRFGWTTHSNASGIARVAGDANGAQVFGYAEGHFATGYVGGQRTPPTGGWRLELKLDQTLRVQVLDAAGQTAAGVTVKIRMYQPDATEKPNWGWVQPQTTAAPDGIAEFRHIQTWLANQGQKKREFEITSWRASINIPGLDDAGIEFDQTNPPAEPIVLHMPATGRLTARLLHVGQPLTRSVAFSAYRGEAGDTNQWNTAPQVPVDEDGWARFPHVALGGSLNVLARAGHGTIDQSVEAPTSIGQEVRAELTTDSIFVLTGRLLGPDGKLFTNAKVTANFDLGITSGGGQVETDAQGRFVWLTTKGYKDTAQIKHLVLSHSPVGSSPLRVSVPPRDITRGINDLGDLQLTTGPLVVSGRFDLESAETKTHVQFNVQRLNDRRRRDGTETWDSLQGVTTAQHPDSTFEVRGETQPGRYRLFFPGYSHLPISPIEFVVGTKDLVIPVQLGYQLAATCIPPEELLASQLRGVLRPSGEVPAEPDMGRWGRDFDRYTARVWDGNDPAQMQWHSLPEGTYTLELCTTGLATPILSIDDVVVPPPKGGDPRLQGIDLRGKVKTVKLQITLSPASIASGNRPIVFPMPQADEKKWQGIMAREDSLVMPVAAGPINLMVTCEGYKPQQLQGAEQEAKVTLETWPSVDLTFANLPKLPDGITLWVSIYNQNAQKQYYNVQYSTEHQGGPLDSLLAMSSSNSEIKDGKATVQIGEGNYRISAYLSSDNGSKSLKTLNPKEIQGGANLAPIAVQWSEEELRAAIAELQKPPEKK